MEEVIKYLKQAVERSNDEWENLRSHAFIVGFLEQTIKNAITDLETIKNK